MTGRSDDSVHKPKASPLDGSENDLRSSEEELAQLQRKNGALQQMMEEQIDRANWALADLNQVEDDKIEATFDIIFSEKIITWSKSLDGKEIQAPTGSLHSLCCKVSPWCETEDSFRANIQKNNHEKHCFLRGLVARVLCDEIFHPAGKDYWLDEETRTQFQAVENAIQPKGGQYPNIVYPDNPRAHPDTRS